MLLRLRFRLRTARVLVARYVRYTVYTFPAFTRVWLVGLRTFAVCTFILDLLPVCYTTAATHVAVVTHIFWLVAVAVGSCLRLRVPVYAFTVLHLRLVLRLRTVYAHGSTFRSRTARAPRWMRLRTLPPLLHIYCVYHVTFYTLHTVAALPLPQFTVACHHTLFTTFAHAHTAPIFLWFVARAHLRLLPAFIYGLRLRWFRSHTCNITLLLPWITHHWFTHTPRLVLATHTTRLRFGSRTVADAYIRLVTVYWFFLLLVPAHHILLRLLPARCTVAHYHVCYLHARAVLVTGLPFHAHARLVTLRLPRFGSATFVLVCLYTAGYTPFTHTHTPLLPSVCWVYAFVARLRLRLFIPRSCGYTTLPLPVHCGSPRSLYTHWLLHACGYPRIHAALHCYAHVACRTCRWLVVYLRLVLRFYSSVHTVHCLYTRGYCGYARSLSAVPRTRWFSLLRLLHVHVWLLPLHTHAFGYVRAVCSRLHLLRTAYVYYGCSCRLPHRFTVRLPHTPPLPTRFCTVVHYTVGYLVGCIPSTTHLYVPAVRVTWFTATAPHLPVPFLPPTVTLRIYAFTDRFFTTDRFFYILFWMRFFGLPLHTRLVTRTPHTLQFGSHPAVAHLYRLQRRTGYAACHGLRLPCLRTRVLRSGCTLRSCIYGYIPYVTHALPGSRSLRLRSRLVLRLFCGLLPLPTPLHTPHLPRYRVAICGYVTHRALHLPLDHVLPRLRYHARFPHTFAYILVGLVPGYALLLHHLAVYYRLLPAPRIHTVTFVACVRCRLRLRLLPRGWITFTTRFTTHGLRWFTRLPAALPFHAPLRTHVWLVTFRTFGSGSFCTVRLPTATLVTLYIRVAVHDRAAYVYRTHCTFITGSYARFYSSRCTRCTIHCHAWLYRSAITVLPAGSTVYRGSFCGYGSTPHYHAVTIAGLLLRFTRTLRYTRTRILHTFCTHHGSRYIWIAVPSSHTALVTLHWDVNTFAIYTYVYRFCTVVTQVLDAVLPLPRSVTVGCGSPGSAILPLDTPVPLPHHTRLLVLRCLIPLPRFCPVLVRGSAYTVHTGYPVPHLYRYVGLRLHTVLPFSVHGCRLRSAVTQFTV